jgi:hypothetical protein
LFRSSYSRRQQGCTLANLMLVVGVVEEPLLLSTASRGDLGKQLL